MLRLELRLGLLPQVGNPGHIHLLQVRELCGQLECLHHLGGGDLPNPVHLLGGANEFGLGRIHRLGGPVCPRAGWLGRCLGGRCFRGSGCLRCGHRSQHVLLPNPATDAGAGHRGQVNAMLVGQLAHERRHIRQLLAGIHLCRRGRSCRCWGGRGFRLRSGGWRCRRRGGFWFGLRGWCRCGRSRCGVLIANADDYVTHLNRVILFEQDFYDGAGDGGGDFGVDLVCRHLKQCLIHLDGVTHRLQPLGNGALSDRLAQLRHHHINSAGGGRCSRCGGSCGCGRRGGGRCRLRFGRCSWGCRRGGRGLTSITDDRNHITDLNGVVFLGADLQQNTGDRGRHLRIHLVGRNLKQRFINRNRVPYSLQPLCDRAFSN